LDKTTVDMAFPVNHKTVFVLDHSPIFGQSCAPLDLDQMMKSRAGSAAAAHYIPLPPVYKSMWTCAAEAVLEYCRIVWDIFPTEEKLIEMVVSGASPVRLTSWDEAEQNCGVVSTRMSRYGRPEERMGRGKSSHTKDLSSALSRAVESLSEMTPVQRRCAGAGAGVVNRGRIVCITSISDERKLQSLLASVEERVAAANSELASSSSPNELPLSTLDLDIVHCQLGTGHAAVHVTRGHQTVGSVIRYQVFSVDAGEALAKRLLSMALNHYELASTTVTGIPMKEEQNASSSASYDVELFHSARIHQKTVTDGAELVQTQKEGCEYATVTLKWCTPRGSTSDLNNCTATARITPTDVTSRPSSCLTNFLLAGRSVMLEMPATRRSGGAKVISHMLTSHGGEIFVHTLSTARSVLEDPPAISEMAGGRVGDYRIEDLKEAILANRLAPHLRISALETNARTRVERTFRVFPYTRSTTTIFEMQDLEPLQKMMIDSEMTEEDLAECRKVIYTLLNKETKGDMLPVPALAIGGKTKTMKKEEQYRVMYTELEKFLAAHEHSERHAKVLDCLLECRNKPPIDRSKRASIDLGNRSGKGGIDEAIVDKGDGVMRSTTQSPMSPPPAKRGKTAINSCNGGGLSVLDMFNRRAENEHSKKHVPFAGTKNIGEKAKLYLNLEKAAAAAAGENQTPIG